MRCIVRLVKCRRRSKLPVNTQGNLIAERLAVTLSHRWAAALLPGRRANRDSIRRDCTRTFPGRTIVRSAISGLFVEQRETDMMKQPCAALLLTLLVLS
jgi:hypothetical protein